MQDATPFLCNQSETLREISKAHRKSVALTLEEYSTLNPDRDMAMANAYMSGTYTMAEIGKLFAVHYMSASRAVRKIIRGGEIIC